MIRPPPLHSGTNTGPSEFKHLARYLLTLYFIHGRGGHRATTRSFHLFLSSVLIFFYSVSSPLLHVFWPSPLSMALRVPIQGLNGNIVLHYTYDKMTPPSNLQTLQSPHPQRIILIFAIASRNIWAKGNVNYIQNTYNDVQTIL